MRSLARSFIAQRFGIDITVFAVGQAGLGAIGSLTPPFGMSLYVIAPIANVDPMQMFKKVLPLWQYWLIAFDIAMAVIIIGGVILIVRRCRKKNKIEIVVEEKK